MKTLSSNALGWASALLSALIMLIVGVLAMNGTYLETFEMMKAHHIGFDATVVGTLIGMVEGAVMGYVGGYLFGWIYNKFA